MFRFGFFCFFFQIPCDTFQKHSRRQWLCWSAQASPPDPCVETCPLWDKFSSQNYTADFYLFAATFLPMVPLLQYVEKQQTAFWKHMAHSKLVSKHVYIYLQDWPCTHCILLMPLEIPGIVLPISQVQINFEMWESLTEGKAWYLDLESKIKTTWGMIEQSAEVWYPEKYSAKLSDSLWLSENNKGKGNSQRGFVKSNLASRSGWMGF